MKRRTELELAQLEVNVLETTSAICLLAGFLSLWGVLLSDWWAVLTVGLWILGFGSMWTDQNHAYPRRRRARLAQQAARRAQQSTGGLM